MCLQAGMDDYVSKPIRIEVLVDALSKGQPLQADQEASKQPGPPSPELETKVVEKPEKDGIQRMHMVGEADEDSAPVADMAVLDPAALNNLLSLLGGEFSYLVELVDSFLEDAPQLLAELYQYVADGDPEGIRRIAHGLKSNGADLGAIAFSDMCKDLEMVGKSGSLDGSVDLLARINAEYAKVEAALKDIQREGQI